MGKLVDWAKQLARDTQGIRQKSDVAQKPLGSILPPAHRLADWIKYGDSVAVVLVGDKGQVKIWPGHICSTPGSHGEGWEVDNIRKTVVWFDEAVSIADCADDAHERSFDPKDPRLIRLDEVAILKDPERCIAWFAGIHPPEIARRISGLLSKPDFGRQEELEQAARASRAARKIARQRLGYYQNGRFHPSVAA